MRNVRFPITERINSRNGTLGRNYAWRAVVTCSKPEPFRSRFSRTLVKHFLPDYPRRATGLVRIVIVQNAIGSLLSLFAAKRLIIRNSWTVHTSITRRVMFPGIASVVMHSSVSCVFFFEVDFRSRSWPPDLENTLPHKIFLKLFHIFGTIVLYPF